MRKDEHKPLSFSTTMRNPERIVYFINCIREFENEILSSEVIYKIIKKITKYKLYKPQIINEIIELKNIYNSETEIFSDENVDFIIDSNPQNHKEKGFEKGWESRFDTWYKLCKEFGFIYYTKNKKIEISESGHMLCDAYSDLIENSGDKIQKIFLNSLVKYQTNNPFRKMQLKMYQYHYYLIY